jgi:hypothetical protein
LFDRLMGRAVLSCIGMLFVVTLPRLMWIYVQYARPSDD